MHGGRGAHARRSRLVRSGHHPGPRSALLRGCGGPAALPDLAVHLRILRADAADLRRPHGPAGLQPRRQPDHGGVRGQARPAGGRRGRARLRQRHGRDQRCGAQPGAQRRPGGVRAARLPRRLSLFRGAAAAHGRHGRLCRRARPRGHGARPGRRPRALSGEPDQLGVRGPGHRPAVRDRPARGRGDDHRQQLGQPDLPAAAGSTAPTSSCTRPPNI